MKTQEQIERIKQIKKQYVERNKEKTIAASSRWNKQNPEKMREAAMRHYNKKRLDSEFRKQKAEKTRRWAKENPDKVLEQSARKRACKLQRMPKWLTVDQREEIKRIYSEAKKLSCEQNIVYHVDHIVPLRGKMVSGLHVPWNLRILRATENMEKSNKFMEL